MGVVGHFVEPVWISNELSPARGVMLYRGSIGPEMKRGQWPRVAWNVRPWPRKRHHRRVHIHILLYIYRSQYTRVGYSNTRLVIIYKNNFTKRVEMETKELMWIKCWVGETERGNKQQACCLLQPMTHIWIPVWSRDSGDGAPLTLLALYK